MASESNSKQDKAPSKTQDDKTTARTIELTMASIEKQFGKGSIMRLGDGEPLVKEVEVVPTGSLALDIALGTGGVPRGRVIEVFGPESSGKTTLALHIISQAQRMGGVCAFIDAEHALDVSYARKLGVRTDDLLVSQPDCGEQALEIADMLVRSGAISVIVVDSVAALTPRAELEGEMGDAHMGLQARLMSQALRKLTATISKSATLVVFINQIRMKIGVMFGSPETTTGGHALKFYASLRLDIRRIGAIKQGEEVIGSRTRVKVVKNKLAPPFRQVEFDILYGEGISGSGDLLDLGVEHGIIEKSGAWYACGGERIGQGRENARLYLKERPELMEQVRNQVLEKVGLKKGAFAAGQVAAQGGVTISSGAISSNGAIAGNAPIASNAPISGNGAVAVPGSAPSAAAVPGNGSNGNGANGHGAHAEAQGRPQRPKAEEQKQAARRR